MSYTVGDGRMVVRRRIGWVFSSEGEVFAGRNRFSVLYIFFSGWGNVVFFVLNWFIEIF